MCVLFLGQRRADILSEWLLFTGSWQPGLTRWLQTRLQPGDVFVDCGANSGFFSLLAASLVCRSGAGPGGVVAIEASASTMELLRANLALNPHVAHAIRATTVAVSDSEGEITLYENRFEPLYTTTVAGAGTGGVAAASDVWSIMQSNTVVMTQSGNAVAEAVSSLAEDGVWRSRRVRCATLDTLLSEEERRAARVIKVDVEGGEWPALRGMARTLSEGRADLEVVLELTPKWLRLHGVSAASVIRHMHELGFHAYKLVEDYEVSRCYARSSTPRPRRLRPGEPLRCEQADVIFSRIDAEWL